MGYFNTEEGVAECALAPSANALVLDAVNIDTERRFDAIYSNKLTRRLGYRDLLHIVPRTPDEAAVQVDSLGERVGFAGRGRESHPTEPGLEGAARYVSRVRDDVEGQLHIPLPLEPQDIHAHASKPPAVDHLQISRRGSGRA